MHFLIQLGRQDKSLKCFKYSRVESIVSNGHYARGLARRHGRTFTCPPLLADVLMYKQYPQSPLLVAAVAPPGIKRGRYLICGHWVSSAYIALDQLTTKSVKIVIDVCILCRQSLHLCRQSLLWKQGVLKSCEHDDESMTSLGSAKTSQMRVQFNGRTTDFQSVGEGSIPFTRSILVQLSWESVCLTSRGSQVQVLLQVPWGCSSVGRAVALQAKGRGFETHLLHQCKFIPQGQRGSL